MIIINNGHKDELHIESQIDQVERYKERNPEKSDKFFIK